MIKIRYIPNILSKKGRLYQEIDYSPDKTIKEYLKPFILEDMRVIVSGKRIKDLDKTLQDNDEIILTSDIQVPAAVWAAMTFWGKVFTIAKIVAEVVVLAYSIYSVVTALTNRPKRPSYGSLSAAGDPFEDSPTYGWEGIQSTQAVDIPVAAGFGRHKLGGNRINIFVNQETQYEFNWKTITPTEVVNSGYVNTFRTPSVQAIRFNLTAQKITLQYNAGTGVITAAQSFRDCIGIYDISGKYFSHYKIEYKKASEPDYILFKQKTKGGVIVINELDYEQYDLRITLYAENIAGLSQNTAYYSSLEGKVQEPASSSEDKQCLNVLLALCEGEIEDIEELKINDNPIENYLTGEVRPEFFIRKGTNIQSVIPNFSDLHNLYNQNTELTKDNPFTYTTVDSDIEVFELHLQLPGGLYSQDQNSGAINSWSVSYKVEHRVFGSQDWVDDGTHTISEKSRSTVRRIFRKEGLSPNKYDIRITRTSEDSDFYHTGDFYLKQVDEIKTDDLSYPNTSLLGLKLLATEQLSGSVPNITVVGRLKKVKAPQIMCQGQELSYDEYYYDNGYKRIIDGAEAAWDGITFVERWSANPVWVRYDLLTHKRYGLGYYIEDENFDLELLVEMANYCDEMTPSGIASGILEKRFRLDVVCDSRSKALELIQTLSGTFRGIDFYSEGLIKLLINKPELPSQLFTMGNIIEGSFQESFSSLRDMPNILEIQFMDEEKDFERETIDVEDEEIVNSGQPLRRKAISLFGVTRISQAIREGRYALFATKYLTRTISFKVGIDAIACQCGDIFEFQHDVPQWGFGGRIIEASINSISVDQPLAIEPGKTYKVKVRHSDDTLEERDVTNPVGVHTVLNVTPDFSVIPPVWGLYAFGELTKVSKPFRILSLQRDNKNEVSIIGLEYNATIFGELEFVLPTDNYSMLSMEIPSVSNLTLTERLVLLGDGTIEDVIDVWFTKPILANYIKKYSHAKIYLSDNGGLNWQYRGETSGESFAIQGGIIDLQIYKVAVVSVTDNGEEGLIENSPQEEITVLGKTLPPSDVTGFEVYQEGNLLKFGWNAIPDVDLARYVIKKGPEWNTAQVIAELIDTTEFMYPVGEIGEVTFLIKAVDTSGNESLAPGIDTLIVTPPPEMNFINNYDAWSSNLEFLLNNLELVFTNDFNSGYVRPAFALKTAVTWEEREAEAQTWEYQEEHAGLLLDSLCEPTGYFEQKSPIDLGTIFEFKVIIDADYKNVTAGSLIVQISYSEDGLSFSGFEDVDANTTYRGRFVRFKFILLTTDSNYNIYFYNCTLFINAPVTLVAWGRDVAIPVIGKTVLFGVNFSYPPRVTCMVVNGVVGFPVVSNKTQEQCDIKVYDALGSPIGSAEIDWEAKGY